MQGNYAIFLICKLFTHHGNTVQPKGKLQDAIQIFGVGKSFMLTKNVFI